MSEEMLSIECFQGIILYGKIKALADIIEYIRNFGNVTLVFDKRSPFKLYISTSYICPEENDRPKPRGGDRAR